ncbi:hypothetical protein Lepto7376_3726 [[Leptolyngbya] sp. PCC 7376]|uniref:hypothetical protein n=1 Tax=[Leptolyngbya] sp. PCC 7376 TaxID=111781 RepID=UPI00029F3B4E|nr:hypothetical protein [[Leptolyngbya] sp. PCC 7376]AFY39902.1 hypothetical protein Lepto7376_3726 [[Leptolyngbya] sp. PCC 7376]
MGCPEQLAVKQDFYDLESRLLSQLATKQQANEILSKLGRVETGIDTSIPGAIANIFDSLISLVRAPMVAAIEGGFDLLEAGLVQAIKSSENVITQSIKSGENVVTAAIEGTENVIVNGINGVTSIVKDVRGITKNIEGITQNIEGITQNVEDIATAGFNTLDNLIRSTERVILQSLATGERLWIETLDAAKEIAPYLESIITSAQDFLKNLINQYFQTLRSLIQALPTDFPDFNFDDASILAAIQGVDRKLGSYPLACGDNPPITGTNTVAGALGAIICGGSSTTDIDNETDTDISNLSTRQLLEKMADAIGINEFPGEVPKTLLNSGDNPERAGIEKIPNLVQFILWIVKQMDALIGEFPFKIKIKDADLVAEGNQELEVEVQNIAEALADIYGYGQSSLIVQNAQTNIMLRLAAETVSLKTATLINQDLAIANQEFMGYRTKRKKRDAQSAFNIAKVNPNNVKSLSQILRSESYKYQGFEFDDSAILLEYLPRFMYAASIIKSAFLRTDESDIDNIRDLADETLADADNGWNNFVNEVNNPDSFFNLNEPDRPFIRDFNDEDAE